MTDHRLIILGLGGIGSAAAFWASRRLGDSVLAFEQFEAGHSNGGSEDHSRIIRLSYHTPGYVELAKSAFLTWEQVEVASGEQLVLRTGGLDLAPGGASIGLDDYRASMTAARVPFEELTAEEVMRRWPQWKLGDDVSALYQDQSGIAMASRANATHRRLAREQGATMIENVEVTSIQETGAEVEVVAGGTSHRAEKVVIAAGAWTNRLLAHLGVEFPLEVTQEQVVYLKPTDPLSFHPGRFPIWIWMNEPSFYGFPIVGEPAVKVAWDRCEIVTDPDHRSFEPRADVNEAVRGFVADHLPGANGEIYLAKTCLYTLTPDRDFVVDRVPGHQNVFTAVGAGHAFKFASLLGRILVDLAIDGATTEDITPFAADRAILTEVSPARSYMV
ncbi:MAG TPA: N-methyl-L-tryptophan oxidase [Acidimicrobiia bacterium]|nr:N-methyl-L-tryptophan oxidase [Acidimicrobiia bacterium]